MKSGLDMTHIARPTYHCLIFVLKEENGKKHSLKSGAKTQFHQRKFIGLWGIFKYILEKLYIQADFREIGG